jgi:thiol-disulfide isomerase/thioredoxin
MRHALKLLLALFLCAAPAASARNAPPPAAAAVRAARVDGVYRRAPSRAARRRARTRRRAARTNGGNPAARGARVSAAARPTVTEIDAEGLRKLLSRGDDPAKARPLLVNFWATWCDPCREEFPDLVKIDAEFRDRGIEFALVSADDVSEIKSGVPAFLQKMRAAMPAYLLNAPNVEVAMELVDRQWHGELPATFLFDREGRVAFKHTGRIKPEELRAALEKVLGAK